MTRSTLVLAGIIAVAVLGIAQADGPTAGKSTGRIIDGQVVDLDGAPIANALVLFGPADHFPRFTQEGTARTDAKGHYHTDLTKYDHDRLEKLVGSLLGKPPDRRPDEG